RAGAPARGAADGVSPLVRRGFVRARHRRGRVRRGNQRLHRSGFRRARAGVRRGVGYALSAPGTAAGAAWRRAGPPAAAPGSAGPSPKRVLTRESEQVNEAIYRALGPVEQSLRAQLAELEVRAAAGAVATRRTYPFFLYDPAELWDLLGVSRSSA